MEGIGGIGSSPGGGVSAPPGGGADFSGAIGDHPNVTISKAPAPAGPVTAVGAGTGSVGDAFASLNARVNADIQAEGARQSTQLADTVTSIGAPAFSADLSTPRYGPAPSMSENIATTVDGLRAIDPPPFAPPTQIGLLPDRAPQASAETPGLATRVGDRISDNFSSAFSTPLGPGPEYRSFTDRFVQPSGNRFQDALTAPVRGFNDALLNGVPSLFDAAGRGVGATYNSLVDTGTETLKSLGMGDSSADSLGRDLKAMPEAFAGSPMMFARGAAPVRAPAAIATETEAAGRGANAFSRLAPGGGLAAHEAAGGHLLTKHVGQTEAQLQARLAAEPKITGSSSFIDRVGAEKAVSETIDANAQKISDWLAGTGGRLRIDHTGADRTGISVMRGAAGATDVSSTRLILVRDPSLATGYRIQTGYPTAP